MARFTSGLLTADNLIGPNKDRDNFGLLTTHDVIGTIMGRGLFRHAVGRELFGTSQAQPAFQLTKSPLNFLVKIGPVVYSAY